MPKQQEPTLAVRYIGRASYWKAKPSLGLGELDFEQGQVRVVPQEMGREFLRHSGLFEQAQQPPLAKRANDDTERRVAKARQILEKRRDRDNERFDLLAQVERMEKDALEGFALERFNLRLDKRKAVQRLRDDVRQYIDQYGVVA